VHGCTMKLAAVTTVRNECDIIESFVRHNAAFFDRIYILDHRCTDSTPAILRKLADEGLPITLSRADEPSFYQGPTMTRLIKGAVEEGAWDFVIPVDSDEFVRVPGRAALESALAELDKDSVGLCEIVNFVPSLDDDQNEPDVLRRVVHRVQTDPAIDYKVGNVILPGAVISRPGFSLSEGQHGGLLESQPVRERRLDTLSLAHFPVRSIDQFMLRSILCRLSWSSRTDYNPGWGWHYKTFIEQLKRKPSVSAADLLDAALLYVDIYLQPEATRHRKLLIREPLAPAYQRLRYTDLIEIDVLPPILDMMEMLLDELRQARRQQSTNGSGSTGMATPSSTTASPQGSSGPAMSAVVRRSDAASTGHGPMKQAVVFVTHIESPRVIGHFSRLRSETQELLDSFLCIHDGGHAHDSSGVQAEFRIGAADAARVIPERVAEKERAGQSLIPGYTDLAYMPALLDPRLAEYGYIWLVEYDADYAGNWSDFFRPLVHSRADLLGSTIFPRSDCPGWHPWRGFSASPDVSPQHQLRSFIPVVRFSQRMLRCYADAMASGSWRGHTEAIYPAIAGCNGLAIEDFGGYGPFVRSNMRGLNYINSPSPDGSLGAGTFVDRPVRQFAYFHESPSDFAALGYLYHPVKVSAG
jgi:hypothetical protein